MSTAARDDALLAAIETHDVGALGRLVPEGGGAECVRDKTLVHWLLEMYLRSERFPACLRLLLARGGVVPDAALTAVLLDDAVALQRALAADPNALQRRFELVSAFTPLRGATLLHVAAEYGHVAAARVLLAAGADVEARAAADAHGGDGHTPLFHAVSSILDHAAPVMRLLLAAGARTDVRLPHLTWGRGFEWETTLFDVTPITWCQAGLLPQWHRREADIWRNVRELLAAGGRPAPPLPNVPNRYLQPRGGGPVVDI
jgi:hypothetical protein